MANEFDYTKAELVQLTDALNVVDNVMRDLLLDVDRVRDVDIVDTFNRVRALAVAHVLIEIRIDALNEREPIIDGAIGKIDIDDYDEIIADLDKVMRYKLIHTETEDNWEACGEVNTARALTLARDVIQAHVAAVKGKMHFTYFDMLKIRGVKPVELDENNQVAYTEDEDEDLTRDVREMSYTDCDSPAQDDSQVADPAGVYGDAE